MRLRSVRWAAVLLSCAVGFSATATAQVQTFDGNNDADGGDGMTFTQADNWDGTNVPNTAGEDAVIDGGAAWDVMLGGTVIIGNLTLGADDKLTVTNNSNFGVLDQLVNAGELALTSTGSITDLRVDVGTTTLSGGGTVSLTSSNTRILDEAVSGTGHLVNVDNVIQGVGQIGVNRTQLTNQAGGVITANLNAQTLFIDPGNSTTMINAGFLRAENGGTLALQSSDYDNTGGVVEALAGSTVQLNGIALSGGTLQTADDGVIRTTGTTALTDVTIDGDLRVDNAANLDLSGTINNISNTITLTSTGSITDLRVLLGTATLTGGGTVALTSSNTRIVDDSVSGTGTLVNLNNTIRGFGQLGVNTMGLTNAGAGLITADVSGEQLIVDPIASVAMVNSGTMQAENGGILTLRAGTYENAIGGIFARTGSLVQLQSGATINHGLLRSEGTGKFTANGNVTLNGITLDGLLEVLNAADLDLTGTINNDASTISVLTSGSFTDLRVNVGTTTLTGGGTVELTNANTRIVDEAVVGTGELVNFNNTIRGVGQVGVNTLTIDNQADGIITADVNGGTLTIDQIAGTDMTNTGVLRAENGGTLQINAGGYDNTDGLIEAKNGSTVALTNGVAITDGTLQTDGTGKFTATGNVALTDLTLDGQLDVRNAADLDLMGTIHNVSNTITVQSTGSITDIRVNVGTATLTGGGTVELTSALARIVDETLAGAGTLVNMDNLIRGFGEIGNDSSLILDNRAAGVITADVAATTLVLDAPSVGDAWTNAGVLRAENGGTLQFNFGQYNNAGGLIEAKTGSNVVLNPNVSINGGTLQSAGTGKFTANGTVTLTDLTFDGLLEVNNAADLELVGTINNVSNTIRVLTAGSFTDIRINVGTTTLTGGGTIELTSGLTRILDETTFGGGTLDNVDNVIRGFGQIGANTEMNLINRKAGVIAADVDSQTLTLDRNPSALYQNFGTFRATNGGTLHITDPLTNNGNLRADDNSLILLSQGLTNDGGRLLGTGTIQAVGGIANNGTLITPGRSPGTLTLDTPMVTNSDATALRIEIGGLTEGVDSDLLVVTGDYQLNGRLEVIFLFGSETLTTTDQIRIVDALTLSNGPGAFGFDEGLFTVAGSLGDYTVIYDEVNGDVILTGFENIVPIPEPASLALLGIGGLVLARRRRSRP